MQLKSYQTEAMDAVRVYLSALDEMREKDRKIRQIDPEMGGDWVTKAWEKIVPGRRYQPRHNGLGEPLPTFCLKIPTGGGKTLLATKTVDLANTHFRKDNRGLILWIVPTTQIYRQTLAALKDRDHPYRQTLDIASAGRSLILERTDGFTPGDVAQNLCVLILMLPAANRQTNETLRMFKDSGGFDAFFPRDDDFEAHEALLRQFPNLDTFEKESGFFGRQVKTSLGNTLRLLRPMIVLDEGQKAYGELARKTIEGFNPCLVAELSATPPAGANVLVDIKGKALEREEMIKLDLHIENRGSISWKDTLLASIEHRVKLEAEARQYEAETGVYIRPICLVQAERTGKDQRHEGYVHSEDVREYLLQSPGITAEQVAVKTSEKDELKEVDEVGGLLSRGCPIRFIITKQALQEGWDCSFAYVLTILTNPNSQTALTQLVGRILRQPYAHKTRNRWLDESYVFCFQRKGTELMQEIRRGFGQEGLGDLEGRVVGDTERDDEGKELLIPVRDKFKQAADSLVFPAFMIRDGEDWRPVHYEPDLLSRVPWDEADVSPVYDLVLTAQPDKNVAYHKGIEDGVLADDPEARAEFLTNGWDDDLDYAFAASHLLDVMPNPWRGNEIARRVFEHLLTKYPRKLVVQNYVFVLDELHRRLGSEKDRLTREVFHDLLKSGVMRFMVVAEDLAAKGLPNKPSRHEAVREHEPRAVKDNNLSFQMSLFDQMPASGLNDFERSVATFLEDQEPLFFWYRNHSRGDYFVQGWKQNRIYADFIVTTQNLGEDEATAEPFNRVYVLETKGRHLSGVLDAKGEQTDTGYKRDVFTLCNQHATQTKWSELVPVMQSKEMRFEVVDEDGWKARLSALINR